MVVRYYLAETDGEPIAVETFPAVSVRFGAFQLRLGSHNTASGNWQCSAGHDDLDALLAAHQALWYTVAYESQAEPRNRTRLTPHSRLYCRC